MMLKRILNFGEFTKLSESSESMGGNTMNSELELSDEKIQDLIQQLAKVGITKQTPGRFKFVDEEGAEYMVMMLPSGEIEIINQIEESVNSKLLTGVVCTMLASGLVSCKKDTTGFGYNFGSQPTEYTLGKGEPNKKILFSRPWGDEELEVDSNTAKQSSFWGSQGSKFERAITPSEAVILKAGHAYQSEKNMNNGRGTRPEQRWNYDPKFSEITGPYYEDEPASFKTCREHPLWNQGLEALRKEGVDVDQLVSKANDEVAKGIVFEYD